MFVLFFDSIDSGHNDWGRQMKQYHFYLMSCPLALCLCFFPLLLPLPLFLFQFFSFMALRLFIWRRRQEGTVESEAGGGWKQKHCFHHFDNICSRLWFQFVWLLPLSLSKLFGDFISPLFSWTNGVAVNSYLRHKRNKTAHCCTCKAVKPNNANI